MQPDSMLVRGKDIRLVKTLVRRQGPANAQASFAQLEPALAKYIDNRLSTIAGRLALAGAPTELVNHISNDVLDLIHTALGALRAGHYRLWKKTVFGKRLAKLDPSLPAQACGLADSGLSPPLPGDEIPF